MALCRRNYTSAYLADIGEDGTNGRLVRRNGKLLRRSKFAVNVRSECFAPGYIPIPTYTLGTDQYDRPTCTPGPFSVWSPFSAREVRNQPLAPGASHLYDNWHRWTSRDPSAPLSQTHAPITLASWDLEQDFDDTYGQHDQVAWHFHFVERLAEVCRPRWNGAPSYLPASVPDWYWAAKVEGTLRFHYGYRFAGGDVIQGVPTGRFYDTEREWFRYNFETGASDGDDGVVEWSAWIYGPREQHRVRGTGLEIYGNMVDFTSDLDTDPTGYASDRQFAALIDTWLRNEVAGIYLMLTTSNATPWNL